MLQKSLVVTYLLCAIPQVGLAVQTANEASFSISTKTFVDKTRERNLVTDIYIPNNITSSISDVPTLIYSHGVLSNKAENAQLLAKIAGLGFRIFAPNSPNPGNTKDLKDKAKDIEFIIKEMAILPKNTVLMGYSLGALASLITGASKQVSHVIALAPPAHELPREKVILPSPYPRPTLMIVGEIDSVAPAIYSLPLQGHLGRSLQTKIIDKGTHAGFIDKGGASPASLDALLCRRFQNHFPKEYKCPGPQKGALKTIEQQRLVVNTVIPILTELAEPTK